MTLQTVVILHCFAGADRAGSFRRHVVALAEAAGLWVLVIDVDIERDAGWDMCDPLLVSAILDWIEQGLIDLLLGGPPSLRGAERAFTGADRRRYGDAAPTHGACRT